jgi:tetratricopeptide (TPR) repeat protein
MNCAACAGFRILAPAVIAALLAGCATKPLEDRDWFEARTPHFEIMSSLNHDDTLRLAHDAESFHAAVEWMLGTTLPASLVPFRIIAYDGRGFSRPFDRRGVPGYFLSTLRGAAIVLRTGDGWEQDASESTLHDTVHYLFRNRAGYEHPLWFDEGSAEFLSTVAVDGRNVDVGRMRRDHVQLLRDEQWMPLTEILKVNDLEGWGPSRQQVFRAESWAFVHFLNFGFERPQSGRRQLADYFERIEQGATTEQAIDIAFGMSKRDLDRKLHKYTRNERMGSVGVRLRDDLLDGTPELRPLPRAEVATRLGWLSLDLERSEQAQRFFEMALEDDPRAVRAHAGLGAADAMRGRWESAMPHFGHALGIAPDDALTQLDVGRFYHRRAIATGDAKQRSEFAALARSHYLKCSQLDGTIPEPVAMYGATFLLAGEDATRAAKPLERAGEMLPSSPEIRLLLARFYAATRRTRTMRRVAVDVYSRSHDTKTRRAAEALMSEVPPAEVLIAPSPGRDSRRR